MGQKKTNTAEKHLKHHNQNFEGSYIKKSDANSKIFLSKNIAGSWETYFKDSFLCLRQFLAAESPLKMMKNAFLFHVQSSFCS